MTRNTTSIQILLHDESVSAEYRLSDFLVCIAFPLLAFCLFSHGKRISNVKVINNPEK